MKIIVKYIKMLNLTIITFIILLCTIVFCVNVMNNEISNLINRIFSDDALKSIILLLTFIIITNHLSKIVHISHNVITSLYCIFYLIYKYLKMIDCDNNDNKEEFICSMKGLDYGTGMAYSYFYGYLCIILPSNGTQSKGLLENMELYENKHGIKFSIKKLIVLIPLSTHLPPDLKEISDDWMESIQSLEEKRQDRAGVKNRCYSNTVYKIYRNGNLDLSNPIYAVIEGASCMSTFYDIQNQFHSETHMYRKYKNEIVNIFYKKLKRLIHDHLECRDLCELIMYNDYDSNGNKINVAKDVILPRIDELLQKKITQKK